MAAGCIRETWRDADGFFYIAGRKKDMLISGGVNVYPAEIEGELLLHPGVRDAAVVGVPHPIWGEMGVAFVVAGQEPPPTPEELAEFLERLRPWRSGAARSRGCRPSGSGGSPRSSRSIS